MLYSNYQENLDTLNKYADGNNFKWMADRLAQGKESGFGGGDVSCKDTNPVVDGDPADLGETEGSSHDS